MEIDDQTRTLSRKIRAGQDERIPYMIILGSDEEEAGTISVRDRFENEKQDVNIDAFRSHVNAERRNRQLEPSFLSSTD